VINYYKIYVVFIIKMDWNQMNENQTAAKNSFYQNPADNFERKNTQSFMVDFTIGATTTFSTTLHEPLKIDKLSDIYLESLTTWKATGRDLLASARGGVQYTDNMAFVMGIDQLPIQSNSSNSVLFNKIIIPNSVTGTSAPSATSVHKSRKLNFICSVNPMTLSTISGSITNMFGATSFAAGGRFIVEFIIVARE